MSVRKVWMRILYSLVAVLLSSSLVQSLSAQVATATLTGIISDPTQGRIAKADLRLANEDTGVVLSMQTNEQGEYTLPLLGSGRYRLAAVAGGFQSYTRSGIVLELGRVTRLDITLQIGQIAESIEVSAAAPLLESETSTVGQFIENKTIADMPLNARRVGELLGLMGHAVFITGDVIRPRVSVAGGRGDQQQWMIDGVNASNIALEVPQALFNPPVEAVQEIRIQQNNYSAEFGNSSGGVVTISTKSGTNALHGNLYEFLRNDKLDARNFFSATKAPLRWNVFGFSVGGPILKNRTFFFTSNEWQKQRIGVTRRLTVPTPQQRSGDFSQTFTAAGALIRIYDPNTTRPDPTKPANMIRDLFPGNAIPATRIDPVAAKIVPLYPLPNYPPTNLAGANNFSQNTANALNLTTWTTKVDHVLGDRDRISGRFILHDFPTSNGVVFEEPAADPNGNRNERRAHSLMINEIHNFSPTMINDFRFNWQPRRFANLSRGLDQGWPKKLGLKGVSDRAFPQITTAGFVNLGPSPQERIQIPIHDTHIVENLSWFHRGHSLKFGGEVRLARNVDDFNPTMSGSVGFGLQPTSQPNVANTGNSIASLLLGFPNSGAINDSDLLDRRAKYFALFVQDDWKVTSNFTFNLGLRWETHTPRFDQNDRQNGFDMHAINPVSGTPGVITFAGRAGLGRNIYNGDYNNFAPRVGLAWKPFGPKTVIRSGYGIFFGVPLPGTNNTSAGFEVSGSFTTPDNGITAPFWLRDGFPDTSRTDLGPGFGAVPVGQLVRMAPEFIEVNRRLGYIQQWNFNIQQDLGWETLLEMSYVGTVGHKLNGPDTNINQVPPQLMGPGNAQVRRPFPQFSGVVTAAPMWGNSSYHGLNLKLEKRFSHGLNFLANYTFSKFIDDVTAAQEIGQVGGGIQNLYNRRAEKSLAGNDVRNRFVFSSVYELPLGKGRRWLAGGVRSMILGGWNLGAILLLQDGSPYGLVTQVNTTNAFSSGSQRVDVLRNPELPKSQRAVERWFDITAVAVPAPYAFGNSGRALLTGDGINNLDLSLLKNHRWGERKNVQFRFESFNLPNHPNFEEPGRSLGGPNFGVVNGARAARIMQLGLKFEF